MFFLKNIFIFSFLVVEAWCQCCQTKVVTGDDDMVGTYTLYTGDATFLDVCM